MTLRRLHGLCFELAGDSDVVNRSHLIPSQRVVTELPFLFEVGRF